MKSTFFQISIQKKFLQLVKNSVYSLDIVFSFFFNVDKDIIQIFNSKDIKLFYKTLIDIALKSY